MKPRLVSRCLLPLLLLIVAGSAISAAGSEHAASIPPVPLPVWRSEVAVPGVELVNQGVPGMALDPDGRPHLTYGGNHLFHAWRDGASWQIETVDPAEVLAGPAIAIDEAGVITIVAFTAADRRRKELSVYSRAPGGAWQTGQIPVPSIRDYPVLSLALDNNGRPHVVTTGIIGDHTALLIYIRASVQGWISETVDLKRSALGDLHLALDSHDQPVILYENDEESDDGLDIGKTLHLVRRGAAGWTDDTIAHAEFITAKSLALDAADWPHVVYNELYPSRLVYLRQTGNGWQTLAEAGDSYTPSLALDDTGRPHVAFTNRNEDLVYAVLGSEGWEQTTIPMVGNGGGHNTLVLDKTGAAHISTFHVAQGPAYATNHGGAWAAMPVAVQDSVGDKHALALDADDRPYLLYHRPSVGELRWAAKEGDTWVTSAVADVGDPPPYSLELAVAMGPNNMAQIAYVDGEADQLVFGTQQSNAWSLAPVTTGGRNLALAVGQDNQPQMILIQGNRLAYWTLEAGTWQSEWISPAGALVFNAFLALDGQNKPHVVYTADGEVIEAVRQSEDVWQADVLPVENVVGMALGPDASLYLLTLTFRTEGTKPPFTFYTLRLSEQVAGEWTHHALFEDFYIGDDSLMGSRLRIGDDGTLHVVARETYGWLRYDRRAANGQWASESLEGYGGSFDLAVGRDGQPRVSRNLRSDLWLYERAIRWLDQHALFPFVPVNMNSE